MASQFSQTTRALAFDSPRASHLAFLIASIGLVAWGLWFVFSGVNVYEVSRHARLESALAPRDIAPLQSGRLSRVNLQVGRHVRAGELLLQIDSDTDALTASEEREHLVAYPEQIRALREQISALTAAMREDKKANVAALRTARARLKEATATFDFAADNERRMRAQSKIGGISEIDALRAASELQKATSSREALTAEVRRLVSDSESRARQSAAQIHGMKRQLSLLEGDAKATKAAASRLQLQVEHKIVRAPVDGVVAEALPLKAGTYVAEGEKVATIVPDGPLIVVGEFNPATALGRVRPGQTAQLLLDGYPWAQFGALKATVSGVGGEVRNNGVRIELLPVPGSRLDPILRHGLTGVAEIRVEQETPARLLLRAAGQAAGFAPTPDPKT